MRKVFPEFFSPMFWLAFLMSALALALAGNGVEHWGVNSCSVASLLLAFNAGKRVGKSL